MRYHPFNRKSSSSILPATPRRILPPRSLRLRHSLSPRQIQRLPSTSKGSLLPTGRRHLARPPNRPRRRQSASRGHAVEDQTSSVFLLIFLLELSLFSSSPSSSRSEPRARVVSRGTRVLSRVGGSASGRRRRWRDFLRGRAFRRRSAALSQIQRIFLLGSGGVGSPRQRAKRRRRRKRRVSGGTFHPSLS